MGKKKKTTERKGKKKRKPKRRGKLYEKYEVKGESLVRKNKYCPKCGQGFTLAAHKTRNTCGKCNYTEFTNK